MTDSVQQSIEHFVTLFDVRFLPLGLSLYRSLREHSPSAELWVVCLDPQVEFDLRKLALPGLHLIPLQSIESPMLLAVKPTRTWTEYCWTLTPFTMEAVFSREESVRRVTYVDADLFFFDSPATLFQELEESEKQVLITEHAYAPEYNQTATSGRFCVQFMTFNRSEAALDVAHWWQERCLECCSEVPVDGKFGDQKYLDEWPTLFGDAVHVLHAKTKAIAPWNVGYFLTQSPGELQPVFYHFHGFRMYQGGWLRWYSGYQIPERGESFYERYIASLNHSFEQLREREIQISYPALDRSPLEIARRWKRRWKQTEAWYRLRNAPF
ncbi:MAG: hypothetical protein KDA65_07575 [Planctomycetaceae bacterium]|nr:hypothetical protein [Planctomycetaceae bacterium]